MTNSKNNNIFILSCLIITCCVCTIGSVQAQNDEAKEKKSFISDSDLLGRVYFDVGFNFLRDAPSIMGTNAFQSKSAGLYYMIPFPLGKKFSFNPSLGVTMEKYSFDQNVVLDYFDDGNGNSVLALDTLVGVNLKRSKLATTYLEAPLELRYHFKGNDRSDGMYLALGVFAGIRLESHSKVKFTEDGIKKLEKKRGEFHQKSIRYGVQGRIGYKGISLFYKHSFSPIFTDQGPVGTADTSYSTIGFSISGL